MSDAVIILDGIPPAELTVDGIAPIISGGNVELIIPAGELNLSGLQALVSGVSVELLIGVGEINVFGSDIEVTLGDTLSISPASIDCSGVVSAVYHEVTSTKAAINSAGIPPTITGNLSVELVVSPASISMVGAELDAIVYIHGQTYLFIPTAVMEVSGGSISSEYSLSVPASNITIVGVDSLYAGLYTSCDIITTLPSFTLSGTGRIDDLRLTTTFPTLEFESFSGGFLDNTLPSFDLSSTGYIGHASNLSTTLKVFDFISHTGSNFDLQLPKFISSIEAKTEIIADISITFSRFKFSCIAAPASEGDFEATIPKLSCDIIGISGNSGKLVCIMPKLSSAMNTISGYSSDLTGSFRTMDLDISAAPSGDAIIETTFPMITIISQSGELSDGVLRYVKERIA